MKIWQEKKELNSGIEQGIEQGIEKIAKELLENGSNIEFVMKITHLSAEKIDKIVEEIKKETNEKT